MRSLHCRRDPIVGLAATIVLVFQLTYTASCRLHAEDAESKATAALALAKAKREREAIKTKAAELACYTDLAAATKEAERTGKPLAVWAGVRCSDYPELRKALSGAVHCHISVDRHKYGEAIVIQGGDGTEFYVKPENLKKHDIADKIKTKWSTPWIPPLRRDVVIVEELSWFRIPGAIVEVDGDCVA